MSRFRPVLIGVGAIMALGVIAVATLRSVSSGPEATANIAEAPIPPTPLVPADAAPAIAGPIAPEPPPPWASTVASDATATGEATRATRERQMAELQQSMAIVMDDALARSASSTAHLRKALDALEAMDDPAVGAQINLDALRHNLEISVQIQDVSRRMKAELNQPRSAERDARIDVLRMEFARLQGLLRADVSKTGTSPAMPTPTAQGR